jgi:hypothetical protein
MSELKSRASVCGPEVSKLVRCGAGGRNHASCCSRRGVPATCLPLCSGVVLHSSQSTCIPYIGNIVQCFEEGMLFSQILEFIYFYYFCFIITLHFKITGTGILPGPVSELHAVKITDTEVTLTWEAPSEGKNITTDYVVHYKKVDNTSMHETVLKLDNVSLRHEHAVFVF